MPMASSATITMNRHSVATSYDARLWRCARLCLREGDVDDAAAAVNGRLRYRNMDVKSMVVG